MLTYGQLAEERAPRGIPAVRGGVSAKATCSRRSAQTSSNSPIVFYAVAALGGTMTMAEPAPHRRGTRPATRRRRRTVRPHRPRAARRGARRGRRRPAPRRSSSPARRWTPPRSPRCSSRTDTSRWSRLPPGEDVALLPYSSGTTGRAERRDADAPESRCQDPFRHAVNLDCRGRGPRRRLSSPHIGGVMSLNIFLSCGVTLLLLPRFDLAAYLRPLQDEGATRTLVAPPVVLELSRNPLVDAVRPLATEADRGGGAPLSHAVARTCRERWNARSRMSTASPRLLRSDPHGPGGHR